MNVAVEPTQGSADIVIKGPVSGVFAAVSGVTLMGVLEA